MSGYILGLDVGDKRIGLALANTIARLPSPHSIVSPSELLNDINTIIMQENVQQLVVGLPLSGDGSDNIQSQKIRKFILDLQERTSIPVAFVNEAHTSMDAETYMQNNRKLRNRKYYDDIAACYIIEEYLQGGSL